MRWGRRTLWLAAMAIGLCALTAATARAALASRRLGADWRRLRLVPLCAFTAGRYRQQADQSVALCSSSWSARPPCGWCCCSPSRRCPATSTATSGTAACRPPASIPTAMCRPRASWHTLRDPDIWPHINRADYAVTLYPPVAQFVFLAVTRLGESVAHHEIRPAAVRGGWESRRSSRCCGGSGSRRRTSPPMPGTRCPCGKSRATVTSTRPCWLSFSSDCSLYVHGRTLTAGVLITLGALIKPLAVAGPARAVAAVELASAAVRGGHHRCWHTCPIFPWDGASSASSPGYVQEEGLASGSGFKLLWLVQLATGPAALRHGDLSCRLCTCARRAGARRRISVRSIGSRVDACGQLDADRVPRSHLAELSLVLPGARTVSWRFPRRPPPGS